MDSETYYPRRAPGYEEIYTKPERQDDLAILKTRIPELLAGRRVLELACGTGWWTQWIAPAAASVLATDTSPEMLARAQEKAETNAWPPGRVSFRWLDAYDIGTVGQGSDALFAGFFWSHVPRERLPRFLASLQQAVAPGARFVFVDNRYVPGSSTPVSQEDAQGNTYQERALSDGTTCEVMKNFPSAEDLRRDLEAVGRNVDLLELPYYWLAWGEFREVG